LSEKEVRCKRIKVILELHYAKLSLLSRQRLHLSISSAVQFKRDFLESRVHSSAMERLD